MAGSPTSEMSYNLTPYPDLSYVQAHPDRLATLATLLQRDSAPVAACRVLEIGCAGGGNLLPIALVLPNSEFMGIDYAARQINWARERSSHLGLGNVDFRVADIGHLPDDLGPFDYIIAHGVYSWVTEEIRDSLLAACKRLLGPNGVAYVSYNTYPGWHFTGIIRDVMLYHGRNTEDPAERARAAREIVAFLSEHAPEGQSGYASLFRNYDGFLKDDDIKGGDDAFLLHDELEAVNEPVYFHEFIDHAGRHGMQYLVEAELPTVLPHVYGPAVMKWLQQMAKNAIELEQYMDFLRNRMFRQTLLCHAESPVQRVLGPGPVKACLVASRAELVSGSETITGAGVAQFKGPDGATLTSDHPVTKIAMLLLREKWPHALSFDEILAETSLRADSYSGRDNRGGQASEVQDQDADLLAANLLRAYGYSTQLVELHRFRAPVAASVTERPFASPVARLEAEAGDLVTNLWHVRVRLDERRRTLVLLLDGSRTFGQIVDAANHLTLISGEASHDESTIEEQVRADLLWLYRAGLLADETKLAHG